MALITCPECGKDVSTEAIACPAYGFPFAGRNNTATPAEQAIALDAVDAQTALLEVGPSWWNFGWHVFFFWLVIPLLVALYRRHSFVMRIYSDRVSVEEGFWSKDTSEFFIKDIRSIDVRQGIWGRMAGIGDVPAPRPRRWTLRKWRTEFRIPSTSKNCSSRSGNRPPLDRRLKLSGVPKFSLG